MKKFKPISINLTNKKVLIIGGGNVALLKSAMLSRFTDDITILAPNIIDELKAKNYQLIYKSYERNDIQKYFMVYACTNDKILNEQINQDCKETRILVSICDNPADSDFVSPAICKIGDITISIGTNGKSPKQAVYIRNQINKLIEDGILKIQE